MKSKTYERIEPSNRGKLSGIDPLVVTKEIRRNDPCPCGATHISGHTGETVPNKFKNCCMDPV